MKLPAGIGGQLVPASAPSEGAVPVYAHYLIERLADKQLRRAYSWSTAIISAAIQELPLLCRHFSAGFVHVNPDVLTRSGWLPRAVQSFLFGGYALMDPEEVDFKQRIISLTVDGRPFPIVLTAGHLERQGRPSHHSGSAAACWVKPQTMSPDWQYGLLTCGHGHGSEPSAQTFTMQAGAGPGSRVTGRVASRNIGSIDAAIVEVDEDWPGELTPLKIESPAAPGMIVDFRGRSARITGNLLRVFHHAPYFGSLFGQRIIVDCAGLAGDRGCLLTTDDGAGLGLCIGTVPDGSGGRDGIFQELDQVTKYFKVEPFL